MTTFCNRIMNTPSLISAAREIRKRIITNSHLTKTPHLGSCLSCVDILVAAYFHGLNIQPDIAKAPERDRFILSKGHGAPALFQVLAMRGFYPQEMLNDYGQDGSIFAEHPPTPDQLPGIEVATGALGHGFPIALGMALSSRVQQTPFRVVALLGDGECNEGTIWEAAMMAAAQRVDNLMAIVDYNGWQATGRSDEVLALAPLAKKWRAFGWNTIEVDGHDMQQLVDLWNPDRHEAGQPTAVIAHTVKGKGVSFMEDDNNWHYRTPNEQEFKSALRELEATT